LFSTELQRILRRRNTGVFQRNLRSYEKHENHKFSQSHFFASFVHCIACLQHCIILQTMTRSLPLRMNSSRNEMGSHEMVVTTKSPNVAFQTPTSHKMPHTSLLLPHQCVASSTSDDLLSLPCFSSSNEIIRPILHPRPRQLSVSTPDSFLLEECGWNHADDYVSDIDTEVSGFTDSKRLPLPSKCLIPLDTDDLSLPSSSPCSVLRMKRRRYC
jgi:hypothetical protein